MGQGVRPGNLLDWMALSLDKDLSAYSSADMDEELLKVFPICLTAARTISLSFFKDLSAYSSA